jgi:hypothetical protein
MEIVEAFFSFTKDAIGFFLVQQMFKSGIQDNRRYVTTFRHGPDQKEKKLIAVPKKKLKATYITSEQRHKKNRICFTAFWSIRRTVGTVV